MVQGTVVVLITLLVYSLAWIGIITYARYCLALEVGDWIQLFILLIALGVLMLESLGQILRVLRKPRLKIANSFVETKNEDSEGEYKELYFAVKNIGAENASDPEVEIKVVENWPDFYPYRRHLQDIYPHRERRVHLCQIVKTAKKVVVFDRTKFPLDRGQVYILEIIFYGRNFKQRKTHRIKLDLSSWENIGIMLDC